MTIPPLRQALAAHIGQVLTPEVAVAIELAAIVPEARPIDPRGLGQLEHDGYLIAAESFRAVLPELHELHAKHWLETERHRHGIALNPDYAAMAALERAGRAIQFTVRHQGRLVGNLRVYVGVSLHTQTRYASEDTLFLLPEHRGGFLVMALIRFAEGALRALGISEFRVSSKLVNNADVLMRRMKYQPVALEFVKFFPKE